MGSHTLLSYASLNYTTSSAMYIWQLTGFSLDFCYTLLTITNIYEWFKLKRNIMLLTVSTLLLNF